MRKTFGNHTVSRDHKRVYYLWHNMLTRCTNPDNHAFRHYGEKGVQVCEEWASGPTEFCAWALANGYAADLSLDRIDPAGNYEPANCRWVPMEAQSGNRRNRQTYTAWGETKSASEWLKDQRCKAGGRRLIRHRVFIEGWEHERALETPPQRDHKAYCARGERKASKLTAETVREIKTALARGETGVLLGKKYGVSFGMISNIKRGKAWTHV